MGIKAVRVGGIQAGAHFQVSLRGLACAMAVSTCPVPSKDCPQATQKGLQVFPLSPFHGNRSKGFPHPHLSPRSPENPQVGTGHLPQPAAATLVPRTDYTSGAPTPRLDGGCPDH